MAGSAALINTYRNQPYAHICVCKNCSSPPVNIASSITASAVSVTSTEPAIIRGGPTRAVGRAALYIYATKVHLQDVAPAEYPLRPLV